MLKMYTRRDQKIYYFMYKLLILKINSQYDYNTRCLSNFLVTVYNITNDDMLIFLS